MNVTDIQISAKNKNGEKALSRPLPKTCFYKLTLSVTVSLSVSVLLSQVEVHAARRYSPSSRI